MKKIILIISAFLFIQMGYGQYVGPKSTNKTFTVKEVRDNGAKLDRSDQQVKLKGFIISQINNNTYEFRDSTGIIRVDIKPYLLQNKKFDDKLEITIIGEVDYDLLEGTEIDVDQVIIP